MEPLSVQSLLDFGIAPGVARAISGVTTYIDGSWVDILSFLTAIVYTRRQWSKRPAHIRGPFLCRDMGIEFFNAASIFPLFLLTWTAFSSKLAEALMSGSRITLSLAGGFALFALLEERKSPASVQPHPHSAEAVSSPPVEAVVKTIVAGPVREQAANAASVSAPASQRQGSQRSGRKGGRGKR